ncbi:contactin-associated protein-like 2 isoform X1 [Oculina patagonica]
MACFLAAIVVTILSLTRAQERSCTTLLNNQPSTPSGNYTIDPDGPGRNPPFSVYCDMSSGVGVTVISHDSESRSAVVGYNNIGSYRRVINYAASIDQLSRLADISVECEQFLGYECLHSRLRSYAWWVSRDGQ